MLRAWSTSWSWKRLRACLFPSSGNVRPRYRSGSGSEAVLAISRRLVQRPAICVGGDLRMRVRRDAFGGCFLLFLLKCDANAETNGALHYTGEAKNNSFSGITSSIYSRRTWISRFTEHFSKWLQFHQRNCSRNWAKAVLWGAEAILNGA